ncbi:DUF3857 domain-containing transglutaminase family protein [Roseateles sp. YR242]|uniref:DUF3857 domain-containing transglutaminase family protein n=1 Tax=Roseateles sp. YR242 TaxID=1855305 RepID=UPI0011605554|nr:DUF3857 domain-containing transglutaminase family protein [Roseateles sp. YR242]
MLSLPGRPLARWLAPSLAVVVASLAAMVAPVAMAATAATTAPAARVAQPQDLRAADTPATPLKGDAGARSAPLPPLTPTPAWVESVTPDLTRTLPANERGVDYLLIDTQTRVTANDRHNYRHRADRIRTERGLDSTGQIEVSFNPGYQTLHLHQLRIHRNGKVLPWQQRARARWLDRETQLEQGIYDGTRTLSLTLDDLRVGDVLEYAYTVSGSNPVFGGRQFGGADLQYAASVGNQRIRLLMPAGREPAVTASTGVVAQRRTLAGGELEWLWEVRDSQALRMDSATPSWFYPYARLAWSEFQDWGAVARWAAPMYQPDAKPTAALQKELDALTAGFSTQEERIAAALRLVQERVRYLSVSIGAGSHAPRRPEQVLAQRFGDCKDKSLLTVALLRGLGVEAWVALVNTELRDHLGDEQPSAGAFDHAIVLARWQGHLYWLDPTRAPQRGTLDQLVQANFGRALVIDAATTSLTPIATAPASVNRREMDIDFDLSQGPAQPAAYQVTTRYFGAAAERMRNDYGSGEERLTRLQKLYLGYYARSFDNIRVAAPLEWQDDDRANRITVTEHYTIDKLWNLNRKGEPVDAILSTPDMDAYLQRPDLSERQHPLQRNHPEWLDMTVRARLPQSWRGLQKDSGERKVEDEQFSFRRSYALEDHTLTVTQHFASHRDYVDPEKMASYVQHLKDADEWSGYRLRWSQGRVGTTADTNSSADSSTAVSGNGNGRTGIAFALLTSGMLLGMLRLLRPPALVLKLRTERHPDPRAKRHSAPVRLASGRVSAIPLTIHAAAPPADDIVVGPGRDGWRGWFAGLVGFAFTMHALIGYLFWYLAKTADDKALLSISNWVYGLGAMALGALIVRWLEPHGRAWLQDWLGARLGGRAYEELLWRSGFRDTFPDAPVADETSSPAGVGVRPSVRPAEAGETSGATPGGAPGSAPASAQASVGLHSPALIPGQD